MNMNITIFMSSLSGGGAERVTCNLANYLSAAGHSVQLLTMAEGDSVEPLAPGITHLSLLKEAERSNFLNDNFLRLRRLLKYRKQISPDSYIVMLPIPTILLLALSGKTSAPVVVSERADPTAYSTVIQKSLRHLAPRAAGYVFQTETVAQWYASCLKQTRKVIIPNAINPIFLREPYSGEREKVIVAAGRLSKQKNFPLLLRSFAAIATEFPEYSLRIYGQGALLSELESLATSLGIADRVSFPGYVGNMPEALEKASLFVLSSDYEGMPNVLMEAMALGLPCVSTDCGGGGARFLIEDGVNGLLVPIRDEKAMAQAMQTVLSDSGKATELSKNARKIQETLAPEKIYGQWEKYIQEIVEDT